MKSKGATFAPSNRLGRSYPSRVIVVALILLATFNGLGVSSLLSKIRSAISSVDHPFVGGASSPAIPSIDAEAVASSSAVTSKLRRYLEPNDGGIHACARFSTGYEAMHLVQWLYYHRRVGISFFHLYVANSYLFRRSIALPFILVIFGDISDSFNDI